MPRVQFMGGFSYIGAREYFEKANFFMPELLLKELRQKRNGQLAIWIYPILSPGPALTGQFNFLQVI